MKLTLLFFAAAILFIASACDVIDNPVQSIDVPIDTTKKVQQNVLLEDYTGHTCGNCPEAAELAHQIQTTYGKSRVIVVAVHAGPFAKVSLPDYPMDFNTAAGTDLDNTFRVGRAGNPNGFINRVAKNGKIILGKDQWAEVSAELLTATPKLGLSETHTWDSTTKTLSVSVDIDYLTDGTADYHLVGLLTESHIISDQTDYRKNPSHIKAYEFDHVMRASMLNGTWGEQISTTAVTAGTKKQKTFTYTFPAGSTWVPGNCEIIIYVHQHETTKEVVQVISSQL
ncbi:MAG: Omp28 family outer membrane lipoprotein [Ignavibacteria bacterium]|nr:Omp28 family outer membrane lipoprotein [Ignavibacteria bacterium]